MLLGVVISVSVLAYPYAGIPFTFSVIWLLYRAENYPARPRKREQRKPSTEIVIVTDANGELATPDKWEVVSK